MLSIEEATYFIPDHLMNIEEAHQWLGLPLPQAKIYKKIYGLNTFPVAERMSIVTFLKKALTSIDKKKVEYIIYAHTAQVTSPFGNSVLADIKRELSLDNIHCFFDVIE